LSKKLRKDIYQEDGTPKQYTAGIIVELKNREGKTVPIKALCDTGTTSTIILIHVVQKVGQRHPPKGAHSGRQ
jgi:hypothetical protein